MQLIKLLTYINLFKECVNSQLLSKSFLKEKYSCPKARAFWLLAECATSLLLNLVCLAETSIHLLVVMPG